MRLNFIKKLHVQLEIERTKEKLFKLKQLREANNTKAAIEIQRIIRGNLTRKNIVQIKHNIQQEEQLRLMKNSAVKIQSLIRGYRCRCGIIELVEKLKGEEEHKEKKQKK